jgi:hypothetical protein
MLKRATRVGRESGSMFVAHKSGWPQIPREATVLLEVEVETDGLIFFKDLIERRMKSRRYARILKSAREMAGSGSSMR